MSDQASPPGQGTTSVRLGARELKARRHGHWGVTLEGFVETGADQGEDWLHLLLGGANERAALFDLVDAEGLVVCNGVRTEHPSYRDVRGRSSRGRLSQGEYYHHDGCSSPTRPRIVEICCPHQAVERHTRTAIAPFPDTVVAMLESLPTNLRTRAEPQRWLAEIAADGAPRSTEWDVAQGVLTRMIRRELSTEGARQYFAEVDVRVGAYCEPWQWGQSRLIANHNPIRTMQHRRAYRAPPDGRPNGWLVKRWPAEVL